ncbi:hypothetical protein B0H10DRAFT_2183467 [Mycena sp. CBHHK59/15]|nr:hypothetical protein B0H10DRAFT_2183467 [Mycena sp. CBHHK59/15]
MVGGGVRKCGRLGWATKERQRSKGTEYMYIHGQGERYGGEGVLHVCACIYAGWSGSKGRGAKKDGGVEGKEGGDRGADVMGRIWVPKGTRRDNPKLLAPPACMIGPHISSPDFHRPSPLCQWPPRTVSLIAVDCSGSEDGFEGAGVEGGGRAGEADGTARFEALAYLRARGAGRGCG